MRHRIRLPLGERKRRPLRSGARSGSTAALELTAAAIAGCLLGTATEAHADPAWCDELAVIPLPDDDQFQLGHQWNLHNTGFDAQGNEAGIEDADVDAWEAWDLMQTVQSGQRTVIAFLDNGLRYAYSDLYPSLWVNDAEDLNGTGRLEPGDVNRRDDDGNGYVDDVIGFNFKDRRNGHLLYQVGHHGTPVASVAIAESNNSRGIAGLASNYGCGQWDVEAMVLKVNHLVLDTTPRDYQDAVHYAVDAGAGVVSASLGFNGSWQDFLAPRPFATYMPRDERIFEAWQYARDAGVIVVHAAGNDGGILDDPEIAFRWGVEPESGIDNLIVVAATDRWDELATFEDGGSNRSMLVVDVAAPGHQIRSQSASGEYTYNTGEPRGTVKTGQ